MNNLEATQYLQASQLLQILTVNLIKGGSQWLPQKLNYLVLFVGINI
jgi:hypothetical protein